MTAAPTVPTAPTTPTPSPQQPAVPAAPVDFAASAGATVATTRPHEVSVAVPQLPTPLARRTRPRRSAWLAWFFRLPVGLYRIGLAEQLGRSTLLLITRGRKTGRRRSTPLNYLVEGDMTYVLSGSGPGSDWLRNLQADPHVQVQVGRRRFDAWAETVVDPAEHRRLLCLWAEQSVRTAPPPAVQSFLRRLGFDYIAAVRRHLEENPPPPMVALRPVPQQRAV